jgi:parallel beta-helix repeat protein
VEHGEIFQCEIADGASGIEFLQTTDCSVSNTTIYGCWIGIHMDLTQNCTIANSSIFNNHRGLFFDSGEYTRIENNVIHSNAENGLEFVWPTNNNTVIGNRFGWNGVSGQTEENAVDHGEDNHFDDGIGVGNAWTDFGGTPPYTIPGTSGNNDSYPELLEDNVNPVISDVSDTAIDVETNGNILTWNAFDEYPFHYTIHIDGVPIVSSIWIGEAITYNLDSQPIGTFVFTVTVFDAAGNDATDVVYVTVVSFVLGGIGTELVMIASGLTVAIFLAVMLIIKKLS